MNRVRTTLAAGVASSTVVAGLAVTPAVADAAPGNRPPAHSQPSEQLRGRGQYVSSTYLRGFEAAEVREWLASDGFDTASVRYGVDAYRVIYRTVDAKNRPTVASGLVVLPRSGERRLRTVSYAHGTMIYKGEAPSMFADVWGAGPAVTFAAAGFASIAPDYVGMGLGPGVHPWKHVPSETTASMDLLRATRQFVPRRGRFLGRDVMVTGFSQGASAALGLARTLQDDPWFRLRAIAPIAGAYAFGDVELPALLKGDQIPELYAVVYASYLLTSWNRIHGLYDDPSEIFQSPYDERVEKFFDGTTTGDEVVRGLPGTLDELLTEEGLAMLRNPRGRFAEALRQDEVCNGWTPKAPLRLYKISNDEQAVTANTDHCHAAFTTSGAITQIVDVGEKTYANSRHLGANLAAIPLITRWFTAVR